MPKKLRRPSEWALHVQHPAVTFPSLSHIQILYVVFHIHMSMGGRRRSCSSASSSRILRTAAEVVAERLSGGSALSMCPSALMHDLRKDVLRLSCLIFIIKCRCL